MTKAELASIVNQKAEEHKSDKDGGYDLIAALSQVYANLRENDQNKLREYLLEEIERENPELWGVALEVLIRRPDGEIAKKLEELSRQAHDPAFKEQLILALLRMGHKALNIYLPHIQSLISSNRPVCAELAHLYRVSPQHSLAMSADFFARELSSEDGFRRAENCISVFVYNYPDEDEKSLASLVEETRKLAPKAATELRGIIIDSLNKPWIGEYLGEAKRNRVLAHLAETQRIP